MKRPRLLVVALSSAVLVLASCGGGTGTSDAADYTDFCLLAVDLDAETKTAADLSSGTISNPEEMKKTMTTLAELSDRLLAAAPEPARESLAVLVDVVHQRNALFATYNYSIQEIAAVPDARAELEAITSGTKVADASKEFSSFMEDACNISQP